jgi:hypothetical protein
MMKVAQRTLTGVSLVHGSVFYQQVWTRSNTSEWANQPRANGGIRNLCVGILTDFWPLRLSGAEIRNWASKVTLSRIRHIRVVEHPGCPGRHEIPAKTPRWIRYLRC